MVRNYKRKLNDTAYDIDAVLKQRAIHKVIEDGLSIRGVALDLNINRSTLSRCNKEFKNDKVTNAYLNSTSSTRKVGLHLQY